MNNNDNFGAHGTVCVFDRESNLGLYEPVQDVRWRVDARQCDHRLGGRSTYVALGIRGRRHGDAGVAESTTILDLDAAVDLRNELTRQIKRARGFVR